MSLVTTGELGSWMGGQLDVARAEESIRLADGWLLSATRMDSLPAMFDAPEDLRAWSMELAALAYVNNPRQMTQRQTGGVLTSWAPDAMSRRAEILASARSRYNTSNQPMGSFPDAQPWPDPVSPYGVGLGYW